MAACTRGSRAKEICASAKTTGTGGISPAFPARWFYGLYAISSVNQCSFATVAPAKLLASLGLDASVGAPGPRDFAVRDCAARQSAQFPSTAFRSTFVTTRTPLHRNGTSETIRLILISEKKNIFRAGS